MTCICTALYENPDCPAHGERFKASQARDEELRRIAESPLAPFIGGCMCVPPFGNPDCKIHGYKATAASGRVHGPVA